LDVPGGGAGRRRRHGRELRADRRRGVARLRAHVPVAAHDPPGRARLRRLTAPPWRRRGQLVQRRGLAMLSEDTVTNASQNAGRSYGLRLDTSGNGPAWHTTTSSSTQSAPALRRSVCRLGQLVIRLPSTTSASMRVHGPWQITAIGRPPAANPRTSATDASWVRRKSGLATPPGSTRPT